jgi:hypothetical protein
MIGSLAVAIATLPADIGAERRSVLAEELTL